MLNVLECNNMRKPFIEKYSFLNLSEMKGKCINEQALCSQDISFSEIKQLFKSDISG